MARGNREEVVLRGAAVDRTYTPGNPSGDAGPLRSSWHPVSRTPGVAAPSPRPAATARPGGDSTRARPSEKETRAMATAGVHPAAAANNGAPSPSGQPDVEEIMRRVADEFKTS